MMAKAAGISVSSVQRIWRAHGLAAAPRSGSSSSPTIRGSSRSCVTWSGSTSTRRRTPSCSRSTRRAQIQALDRTQPGLPLKKGRAGTMTHDYKRHGTTTLFAALNVLDGTVIGRNMARHRHQEFIRFLNAIEAAVPDGKHVHVILDNYAAHKHPKVRRWLDRHPRLTFHFVPTSCSWLNAVEGFFAKLFEAPAQARRLPLHRRPPGRHQPLRRRAQHRTRSPSSGPPIRTRSSPPSNEGTKRWIRSTSYSGIPADRGAVTPLRGRSSAPRGYIAKGGQFVPRPWCRHRRATARRGCAPYARAASQRSEAARPAKLPQKDWDARWTWNTPRLSRRGTVQSASTLRPRCPLREPTRHLPPLRADPHLDGNRCRATTAPSCRNARPDQHGEAIWADTI